MIWVILAFIIGFIIAYEVGKLAKYKKEFREDIKERFKMAEEYQDKQRLKNKLYIDSIREKAKQEYNERISGIYQEMEDYFKKIDEETENKLNN